MLPQEKVVEALHVVMQRFAEENDGADGWRMNDLESTIREMGGEETDFLHAVKLGMKLCGFEETESFHLKPDNEEDKLAFTQGIETYLSIFLTNSNVIRWIALEAEALMRMPGNLYQSAIHALAKEQREYVEQIKEDFIEIKRQLKLNEA